MLDLNVLSLSSSDKELGICLSGGGALGFAHIGVLQALEDHGIFPTQIAGSSMGAIVGTLYAAGYTPAHILELIKEDKLYKITKLMTFSPSFLKSGLSNHSMLRSLLLELIPHDTFDPLKRKMHICVANLNTSEWEIIETGDKLAAWVAASASIPGLFETININEGCYVDGGLLNNMPAQGIQQFCHTIIGVDVMPHQIPGDLKTPIGNLTYSIRTMLHHNSKEGRELCQFLIEPEAIDEFHEFRFDAYQTIYQYGYDAAMKSLKNAPEMLKLAQ